ncbi:hypothetical protein FQN54_006203 [Arachnomyces sp. PD_36]|nr:hypothetical protein FQN54_006203 [Arachnomyces sp. PD_36]
MAKSNLLNTEYFRLPPIVMPQVRFRPSFPSGPSFSERHPGKVETYVVSPKDNGTNQERNAQTHRQLVAMVGLAQIRNYLAGTGSRNDMSC